MNFSLLNLPKCKQLIRADLTLMMYIYIQYLWSRHFVSDPVIGYRVTRHCSHRKFTGCLGMKLSESFASLIATFFYQFFSQSPCIRLSEISIGLPLLVSYLWSQTGRPDRAVCSAFTDASVLRSIEHVVALPLFRIHSCPRIIELFLSPA